MIVDRERLESLQKAMIAANLLVILAIFGGTDYGGTWYTYDFDGNISDGEQQTDYGTNVETDTTTKYLLKENKLRFHHPKLLLIIYISNLFQAYKLLS